MLKELILAFAIVAICTVIHASSMVLFAQWLIQKRRGFQGNPGMVRDSLLLITVVAIVILLHLIETGIWAAFYLERQLFPDYETAFYFSLGSFTTIGYGDVVLPQNWRLLGGVEGLCGVMLCGFSAAFIFAVVSGLLQMRIQNSPKFISKAEPKQFV
jgi:Ion channel